MSASLTDPRAKSTAYLEDAVSGGYLGPLRGRSGKLQAVFRTPGEDLGAEEADPHFAGVVGGGGALEEQDIAPAKPGIYKLAIELDKARRPVSDLQLVTLVPFTEKKKERSACTTWGAGDTKRRDAALEAYANPRVHRGQPPEQGHRGVEHFTDGASS